MELLFDQKWWLVVFSLLFTLYFLYIAIKYSYRVVMNT